MQAFLVLLQVKDYAAELVEPNLAPLSAILQPEDELQFWAGLAASSSCPAPLQQRAAAISSALASLGIKLRALHKQVDMLPEEDMVDFIEDSHQSLEALWEIPLPAAPGVMAVQLVSFITPVVTIYPEIHHSTIPNLLSAWTTTACLL